MEENPEFWDPFRGERTERISTKSNTKSKIYKIKNLTNTDKL